MAELAIGSTLAGYRLDALIARGGMGVVYRATHLGLERPVALKVIARELADREGFRDRFLRESRLAASLDHPAVVPVYDSREVDGELIVAMRLVAGGDLRKLIDREGPLAPVRAIALLGQVGEALDAAHAAGIVHRDVKPHNVLVEDDRAFLSDFGLAKALGDSGVQSGASVVGTAEYMSPEQWRGRDVGPAADIYSLGCVLFEALTGIAPFARQDAESEPEMPAGLDAVIERAVAKDPGRPLPERRGADRRRPRARGGGHGENAGALGAGRPSGARRGGTARARDRADRRRRGSCRQGATGPLPTASWARLGGSRRRVGARRRHGSACPLPARGRRHRRLRADPDRRGATAGFGEYVRGLGNQRSRRHRDQARPGQRQEGLAGVLQGADPSGIAIGGHWLWVTDPRRGTLLRLDPDHGHVLQEIEVGGAPGPIALGGGRVWIADEKGAGVTAVNADGGRIYRRALPPLAAPLRLAVGAGGLWVSSASTGNVRRIDLDSLRVDAPIPVGRGPAGVTVAGGLVWVANSRGDTVSKVDPSIHAVLGDPIEVGGRPGGIDAGTSTVWVASAAEDAVTRIDLESGERSGAPIRVGSEPGAVAVGETAVWVADNGEGAITRIEP